MSTLKGKTITCIKCGDSFTTPQGYIDHRQLYCAEKHEFMNKYTCGVNGCQRHFSTCPSLKTHIFNFHFKSKLDDSTSSSTDAGQSSSSNGPLVSCSEVTFPSNDDNEIETMTTFVSLLYSNPSIPRNFVQTVVKGVRDMLIPSLKSRMLKKHGNSPEFRSEISNLDITKQFISEHKRLQYFEYLGSFHPPIEVNIGTRLDRKRTAGVSAVEPVLATMQIIPIAKCLTSFFSNEKCMSDTLTHLEKIESTSMLPDEPMSNIMHGSVWQNIAKRSVSEPRTLHLPIIIYYDDVEVGNPLSPHAGIHKLGAVYLSLPFLPDNYVSHLKSIFLLALFHASDRTRYGNGLIFEKVISQLNDLKTSGISIHTNVFKGKIKFTVVVFVGDNLGLNGALGFVESFSANYCCRVCLADRKRVNTLYEEDESLFRNKTNYEEQLKHVSPTETGIKERCALLRLIDFDLFENVGVDLLHDWLEGCCQYVMTYVLNYLITEIKVVNLNRLNEKIALFDFGSDTSSKPVGSLALVGGKVSIKTTASEMLTLVRYLTLIVGYNVPEENETWELYLHLRKITDFLLNQAIHIDSLAPFKVWLSEFNEHYCHVTKTHLKPKFHFMTHYPTMIKKFGPLRQIWTMRFEAKHRIVKLIARSSYSRVNICKTICIRNQLILSDFFLRRPEFKIFETSKFSRLPQALKPQLESEFPDLSLQSMLSFSWLKVNNNKLSISSIVGVDMDEELYLPIFAKIENIISNKENIILYCQLFKTIYYDAHLVAYLVQRTNTFRFFKYEQLLNHVPHHLNIKLDFKQFVTLRSAI